MTRELFDASRNQIACWIESEVSISDIQCQLRLQEEAELDYEVSFLNQTPGCRISVNDFNDMQFESIRKLGKYSWHFFNAIVWRDFRWDNNQSDYYHRERDRDSKSVRTKLDKVLLIHTNGAACVCVCLEGSTEVNGVCKTPSPANRLIPVQNVGLSQQNLRPSSPFSQMKPHFTFGVPLSKSTALRTPRANHDHCIIQLKIGSNMTLSRE